MPVPCPVTVRPADPSRYPAPRVADSVRMTTKNGIAQKIGDR